MNDSFFDLNDADSYVGFGTIPDKTYARIHMSIRPGDTVGPDPQDGMILTQSKSSDVKMLNCEFTVVNGQCAKRKFWQNLTVSGGTLDDKGVSKGWNITKSMLRSMVDSALGLSPDDESDAAKQKRRFNGFRELNHIEFAARIDVVPGGKNPEGGTYQDKNAIGAILTVKDHQYQAAMRGEALTQQASTASGTKAAASPPWQQGNGAGAAAPAAAAVSSSSQKPAWMK